MKPFYGFGNYLTDSGSTLGSNMVFVMADDDKAARVLLIEELSANGDIVPNSLKVCRGSSIPVSWLMAAAMQSEEADWSSDVPMAVAQPVIKRKEYLN